MIVQPHLRACSCLTRASSSLRPLSASAWRPCQSVADHHHEPPSMELDPQVQQLIAKLHANDSKAVVYVTGGAVQAISWLLSVPGASNTVLECSVPYARDSLVDVLGHEPEKFCCEETAVDMAVAAYRRAAQLTGFGSHILGVGATCALATVPLKRGDHRAYLACHDGQQGTQVTAITFAKGARTRVGEDGVASMAILELLAQASGVDTSSFTLPLLPPQPAEAASSTSQPQLATLAPDTPPASSPAAKGGQQGSGTSSPAAAAAASTTPQATPLQPAAPGLQGDGSHFSTDDVVTQSHISVGDPLEALLAGRVRCVEFAGGRVVVDAPRRGKIYLPGSFNPLHKGHQELLHAAVATLGGEREAAFELSVGNPDKGLLPLADVKRRVQQFIDADIPLLVTSCALFTDKAELFKSSVFVVGYDTAIRLVMPKYYGGTEINMLLVFERLRAAGCSFLVAGRKDVATGQFRTLQDVQVPPALSDLFKGLSEDEFRVDLSSTELRSKSPSPATSP